MTKTAAALAAVLLACLCAGCGSSPAVPHAAASPSAAKSAACSLQATICGSASSTPSPPTTTPQDAAKGILTATSSISPSEFDTIGAGGGYVIARPTAIKSPALTENGKPTILYVGAEWCPYCAAQRWVLAVALSRFGTLSHVGQTQSSSTDVYPATPTLTFYGSTYRSPYIVFDPNEIENNQQQTLQTLSRTDQTLFTKYAQGGFPFVDVGGKDIVLGAMYNPGVLHVSATDATSASLSLSAIEAALRKPDTAIAKSIIGSANVLTAAICTLTNDQPATVCRSAGVRAAA